MPKYIAKQGDHVSGIATQFGLASFRKIWDHPNNADLKSKRLDPNILLPDDELFIPEKQLKTCSKADGQKHKFKLKQPKLKLRIVLRGTDSKPIANAKCTLVVEGQTIELTSQSDGSIEQPIQPGDKSARVTYKDPKTSEQRQMEIGIGTLDPLDAPTGQSARLSNLGYFVGDVSNPDEAELNSAIEEFQCDQRLTVDGDCGPNTRSKLKDAHGS